MSAKLVSSQEVRSTDAVVAGANQKKKVRVDHH